MCSKKFESKLMAMQGNLLNFAFILTSNRDDAYDLLQDTTLKALDNEDKYVENVNFKGWVFTIMRNIFINNYRKVVRESTIIDQTEDLYHLNLPQDSGFETPEGAFAAKEINEAINSFADEYRIPFSMHVAGYKYNEIAEEMEFHPNAADSADKCGFLFLRNGSACRHKCERCDSRGTADFPESLYPAKEIALNRIKHYCDRHQHFRDRHFRIFNSDFLRNICKTAR